MDDSCAVCAGTLEWVAYGACGHREVCSTCVVRLRFICNDRRCCICKVESDVIFVTKALGDYTTRIKDFSVLQPYKVKGRVGSYWYHDDTQAFFDNVDHYDMIKAMCKVSCNACHKIEERFNEIEHLRDHLFDRHRLFMCSLCLEGRKAFICEQKLYTRAQLNQHINTGDSEVDGTESERGGFMGHPKCKLCKIAFYGESELHSHISREHFTCHICQRQRSGQCKNYKNYDDLEIHFRRDHYRCEDESCLAKKFIVFRSADELNRHNTSEHGGHMSRAPCNEHNRYRRGRMAQCQPSDNECRLSMSIKESLGTSNVPSTSLTVQVVSAHGNHTNDNQNNTEEAHQRHRKHKNKESISEAMKGSSRSSRCVSKAINIAAIASLVTGNEVAQTSYLSSSHAKTHNLESLGNASRIRHSVGNRILRIVEEVLKQPNQ